MKVIERVNQVLLFLLYRRSAADLLIRQIIFSPRTILFHRTEVLPDRDVRQLSAPGPKIVWCAHTQPWTQKSSNQLG